MCNTIRQQARALTTAPSRTMAVARGTCAHTRPKVASMMASPIADISILDWDLRSERAWVTSIPHRVTMDPGPLLQNR